MEMFALYFDFGFHQIFNVPEKNVFKKILVFMFTFGAFTQTVLLIF